jgi:hypothetical protein
MIFKINEIVELLLWMKKTINILRVFDFKKKVRIKNQLACSYFFISEWL